MNNVVVSVNDTVILNDQKFIQIANNNLENYNIDKEGIHKIVETKNGVKLSTISKIPLYAVSIMKDISDINSASKLNLQWILNNQTFNLALPFSIIGDYKLLYQSLTAKDFRTTTQKCKELSEVLVEAYGNEFRLPNGYYIQRLGGYIDPNTSDYKVAFPNVGGVEIIPEQEGGGESQILKALSYSNGSLSAWEDGVLKPLLEKKMNKPLFTTIVGAVSPLIEYFGVPNFICEVYGKTSGGKSTDQQKVASMYGEQKDTTNGLLISNWTATVNSLQRKPEFLNGVLFIVDDTAKCQENEQGKIEQFIYSYSDSNGKETLNKDRSLRATQTKHGIAYVTGEDKINSFCNKGGSAARCVSISFDNFYGEYTAKSKDDYTEESVAWFNKYITAFTNNNGHVMYEFISRWNNLSFEEKEEYKKLFGEIKVKFRNVEESKSSVKGRVSEYYAVIEVGRIILNDLMGWELPDDIVLPLMKEDFDSNESLDDNFAKFAELIETVYEADDELIDQRSRYRNKIVATFEKDKGLWVRKHHLVESFMSKYNRSKQSADSWVADLFENGYITSSKGVSGQGKKICGVNKRSFLIPLEVLQELEVFEDVVDIKTL